MKIITFNNFCFRADLFKSMSVHKLDHGEEWRLDVNLLEDGFTKHYDDEKVAKDTFAKLLEEIKNAVI